MSHFPILVQFGSIILEFTIFSSPLICQDTSCFVIFMTFMITYSIPLLWVGVLAPGRTLNRTSLHAYPFQIFSQRIGEEQSQGSWQSTTAYVAVVVARVIGYDLPFWVDGVNTINLRSPTSHEKGAHCRGPEKSIHQIEPHESRIPCSSDIMD